MSGSICRSSSDAGEARRRQTTKGLRFQRIFRSLAGPSPEVVEKLTFVGRTRGAGRPDSGVNPGAISILECTAT